MGKLRTEDRGDISSRFQRTHGATAQRSRPGHDGTGGKLTAAIKTGRRKAALVPFGS